MGTGKSAIGKKVAKSLGFRFVDTDHQVERKAGKKVSDLFADPDEGEAGFRRRETEVLRNAVTKEGQVISTGGGLPTIEENREILKGAGFVIWLKAHPDTIYERVRHNRERPLLRVADPKAAIEQMLADREVFYRECADNEINTSELTLDESAHGVAEEAIFALR